MVQPFILAFFSVCVLFGIALTRICLPPCATVLCNSSCPVLVAK